MRFCIGCDLPLASDHETDGPYCCEHCSFLDRYGDVLPDMPVHTEACVSSQMRMYRLGSLAKTIILGGCG
jgi:hypothetical protein